jgi:hypothetical protein
MFHTNRRWKLATVAGAERFGIPHGYPDDMRATRERELRANPAKLLGYLLVEHSWTLCTGWAIDGYAFLNDSTSPDGAGEWAIVRLSDGAQLESVTFSWMERDEAEAYIARVLAGELDGGPTYGSVPLERMLPPDQAHECAACR